jgi:chromosomal replication initiation ATPase DnaA
MTDGFLLVIVTEQLTLSFLDREFEKTLKEMRDALENLATCAAIRASGIGDFRSAQEDQQMASLLSKKHRFEDNQTYNQVQLYQLPYFDDQNFLGRSDVITKIAQALEPRSHSKALFFSIWGLGGIGKTQLALAFAHKSKHTFQAIFWIRAETEASIQKSFTDIALCLNIPGAARMNKHNENRDLVLTWLIRYGK